MKIAGIGDYNFIAWVRERIKDIGDTRLSTLGAYHFKIPASSAFEHGFGA